MNSKKPLCGFIGQGFVGKNLADNFESRGYEIVRYAKSEPYCQNQEKLKYCDITFVAVPTPTTPEGFDSSILEEVLKFAGDKKIVVIKSTILPQTTEVLQGMYPELYLFHSPEFLTEKTALYDTFNPQRNIIGLPIDNEEYRAKAKEIISHLPLAPYNLICSSKESAFIKYAGNCWFYVKVIFINLLYDLISKYPECRWETIKDALGADSRVGYTHLDPVHKSGRGASGHCFLKDMEAFRCLYNKLVNDYWGKEFFQSTVEKNLELLKASKKDLDLVAGVYGENRANN